MKTNTTVIEISDILTFAEKELNISWNQAHEDLTPFIRSVYNTPFKFLLDFEDLFSDMNESGKTILKEFIKKHNLDSQKEILVIK